jgi:hypothetical protein
MGGGTFHEILLFLLEAQLARAGGTYKQGKRDEAGQQGNKQNVLWIDEGTNRVIKANIFSERNHCFYYLKNSCTFAIVTRSML